MSNELQIFDWKDDLQVRSLLIKDEPWFIAKDVALALGYSQTEAMTRRMDEDELQNLQVVGFGNRGVNVINESGLYEAILGSKKKSAKKFKKWVRREVLPSIRKHGAYMTNDVLEQTLTNPDFAIGLLQNLKKEKELREEAERTKAHISDKKTATAMATASVKSRENEKLKQRLDESLKYSTTIKQSGIHSKSFPWGVLKKASQKYGKKPIEVPTAGYPQPLKGYHALAWKKAYGIDIETNTVNPEWIDKELPKYKGDN